MTQVSIEPKKSKGSHQELPPDLRSKTKRTINIQNKNV